MVEQSFESSSSLSSAETKKLCDSSEYLFCRIVGDLPQVSAIENYMEREKFIGVEGYITNDGGVCTNSDVCCVVFLCQTIVVEKNSIREFFEQLYGLSVQLAEGRKLELDEILLGGFVQGTSEDRTESYVYTTGQLLLQSLLSQSSASASRSFLYKSSSIAKSVFGSVNSSAKSPELTNDNLKSGQNSFALKFIPKIMHPQQSEETEFDANQDCTEEMKEVVDNQSTISRFIEKFSMKTQLI